MKGMYRASKWAEVRRIGHNAQLYNSRSHTNVGSPAGWINSLERMGTPRDACRLDSMVPALLLRLNS